MTLHHLTVRLRRFLLLMTALSFATLSYSGVASAQSITCPTGMPALDCDALNNGWVDWVPDTGNCSTTSSVTLVGNSNEDKIWNYFIGKGLAAGQVAGIVGNLQRESTFDPQIVQNPPGGNSATQPLLKLVGWGLAQWTFPYQVVTNELGRYAIAGTPNDLATQLNLIWAQMTNTSPVGAQDMAKNLPNDPTQAATYFDAKFEGGTDPSGIREQYAVTAMQQYGNSSNGSVTSGSNNCNASPTGSPQCATATGSAKLICEAYKYDPTSYQESAAGGHEPAAMWHSNCPTIGPSCYTDCSGLVNLAVYDAYGVDLAHNYGYNTTSERSDPAHWERISFNQLQPGDIMQPAAEAGGHVAIVDHVVGKIIYTFESYNPSVPQPDQVGPGKRIADPNDLYLHWVGPGAS